LSISCGLSTIPPGDKIIKALHNSVKSVLKKQNVENPGQVGGMTSHWEKWTINKYDSSMEEKGPSKIAF